jgi:hypothetical protein
MVRRESFVVDVLMFSFAKGTIKRLGVLLDVHVPFVNSVGSKKHEWEIWTMEMDNG